MSTKRLFLIGAKVSLTLLVVVINLTLFFISLPEPRWESSMLPPGGIAAKQHHVTAVCRPLWIRPQ